MIPVKGYILKELRQVKITEIFFVIPVQFSVLVMK